jgi:coupling of ubiquitin conjugation to ER degradation protein 1
VNQPPPSFQPNIPAAPASSRPNGATSAASKSSHPDLITRYKLHDKLVQTPTESGSETESSQAKTKSGWTQNKAERQQLLQRRREEMILAARRKLEEKERAAKAEG